MYSPRALFGESEFISALTSRGKTILNAKDDEGEFPLVDIGRSVLGSAVFWVLVEVLQEQDVYKGCLVFQIDKW